MKQKQISNYIKEHKNEIINFIQKLVQIPSQNNIDPEKNIAELISEKMNELGFKSKLVGKDNDRPSVIGESGNGKKRLLFDAPIDTVPAGDFKKWKYPPFSGKILDDKLYGRGSADCKAGIATLIFAANALKECNAEFDGKIVFVFDSDEQSGNMTGIKYLLNYGLAADSCVIAYPGTDKILIGARGVLRLEILTHGESVHTGSKSKKGINAIAKMVKVLNELENMKMSYKPVEGFTEPRLTTSLIEGGESINITPSECRAKIDIRLIPKSKNNILNNIKNIINKLKKEDEELKVEIKQFQYIPPYIISKKEKIVQLLSKNANQILRKSPEITTAGAAGIGNLIANKGIPTITGFGVDFENAHGYNEFIYLKSIVPVTIIYALTALDYLK